MSRGPSVFLAPGPIYQFGRHCTAWMDNIKMWTTLSVEESIRMTEDRDKWRKYVHGVANPRIEDGKEQNRTEATETFTPCSNIKGDTNLIAVILLSNLNRFLKFLNRQILRVICNKAIIKDPTTLPYVVLPDSSPSDCVTKKRK